MKFQSEEIRPGQFIVVDPAGRIVRIADIITSWAARTYRVETDGTFTRVA